MPRTSVRSSVSSLKTARLDPKTRKAINKALSQAGFDGSARFVKLGHAHAAAFDILRQYGYEPTTILTSFESLHPTGTRTIHIAKINPSDPYSPEPVTNSALAFQHHLLRADAYEVIAYLS